MQSNDTYPKKRNLKLLKWLRPTATQIKQKTQMVREYLKVPKFKTEIANHSDKGNQRRRVS